MELESETLDWVDYPIIPGNKVAVNLTPLGVSGNYRIDSVDIHIISEDHKLVARFTIENTPSRTADYLYNLSKRIRQLGRNYANIR